MTALEKAKLQKVEADEQERPIGEAVDVQFNPTSLTLKLRSQIEGGRSNARQRRQQTGTASNVLSMELIFDTADEGTEDQPVSVRGKTAIVEQFVLPEQNNPDPPPRLQFQWDALVFTGIVEDISIEFDLFAASGVPLRAKVGLSIKEQIPSYQFLRAGAGARDSSGATEPGGGGAGAQPGAAPTSPTATDRVASALDGESPAEFAARQGLDPTAWRGLGADLSLGAGFSAGVEVGFSASLSASAGLGASVGIQASAGVSLEAALGLSAGGRTGALAAGKAVAEAGGVAAALDGTAIARADAAAGASARAFAQPAPASAATGAAQSSAPSASPASPAPSAPSAPSALPALIERTPLAVTGPRSHSARAEAAPRPPQPAPDRRSLAFGLGVPLQPLRASTSALRAHDPCRRASGPGTVLPPVRRSAAVAPWVALPAYDETRGAVDAMERARGRNPCDLVLKSCECEAP